MVGKLCAFVVGFVIAPGAADAELFRADEQATPRPDDERPVRASFGEDALEPFVPETPRTAEDRARLDSLREYATARALEDQRRWSDAIDVYREALEKEPESVAILRRLSRLCFILGRTRPAVEYAERVLAAEPGDTTTLTLIIEYYERRNDPAAAEALLLKVLDNPKLDRASPGYVLIYRDLGELYATKLSQPAKAADAFEKVMKALDDKTANRLTLADQRRLLGFDEAATYAGFGQVFQDADRHDLAIVAFRRGLVYDPDNPLLPRLLTRSLLDAGRFSEALRSIEAFLKRQPQGQEPYEMLVEALEALGREDEVLPRLEAAAASDRQNLPLKYLLADRYREERQPEKADALYKEILAIQPDPQGFGSLAASLMRDVKYEELLELLGKAFLKPDTLEAVKPQIETIANDPEIADALLDEALELQRAEPPRLGKEARMVLAYIATKADKLPRFIEIQRLALKRDPDPQAYRELFIDLYRSGMHAEAATTIEEMLQAFPNERTPQILVALGQSRALAGKLDEAEDAVREAIQLDPDDQESLRFLGYVLNRLGRNEELITHYESMLERFPNDDELMKYIRSGLSIVYVNMGDFRRGEQELEKLLELYPDDPGVNNDLGYLYADQGKDLERAESMIRKAIAEDPENASYLDSLGWVLYKQGKLEGALEYLESAVEQLEADSIGSDATILDHLGDVHFRLKQLDAARDAWTKAEQSAAGASPPDKRLDEIRKKLESLEQLDPVLLESAPGSDPKP